MSRWQEAKAVAGKRGEGAKITEKPEAKAECEGGEV